MIKSKAIRKIFITTATMFILLTVFSIPMLQKDEELRVNMEVDENVNVNVSTNDIYLLNENNYLVKANILLDSDKCEDNILKVINNLIISDTSKFSNGLRGVIPEGTKVNEIICGSELVTINFSKDILNVSLEDEYSMISSIVYSVLGVNDINGVSILVDGKNLDSYPNSNEKLELVLNKNIGINKEFELNSRENINSVVIYYLENIDDEMYYVPVTKYVNDDREKIKIIIEELTTRYIHEENLMSFLNSKAKLLEYKVENDILFLNFNEYLFDNNDKLLEEVIYSIGYSVFDNYDVSMVMFEVNGREVGYVSRK